MKTIYLHGYLADLHSEPIRVEASSVAEAVRSLSLIPALQPEAGQYHAIEIDNIDTDIALFAQGGIDEIHIRPRRGGSGGKGGFLQVVLGIALISLAVFLGPAGLSLGAFGTISQGSIFLAGAMMALGGVLQLLAPVPKTSDGNEESSKFLPANGNTVRIGTRIPILYGTRKVFGHYLTFDVDAKEVVGGTTTGVVRPISGLGDAWAARTGGAPFDMGDFSYTIYTPIVTEGNIDRVLTRADQFPPTDPWGIFASGFVDTVDPDGMVRLIVLSDERSGPPRGYVAKYVTQIQTLAAGTHEINLGFTGSQKEVQVFDSSGVEVPNVNDTFNLALGEKYDVTLWFFRNWTLNENDGPFKKTLPPTVQIKNPGGVFEDLVPNTTQTHVPEPLVLESSLYVVHDEVPISDGLAVLRPIYASAVASLDNVPTSDWSI